MMASDWPIWLCFFMLFGIEVSQNKFTKSECNGFDNGPEIEECPSDDCSQPKRNDIVGDSPFNCTIGIKKDWEKYQMDNTKLVYNRTANIGPPMLKGIDFYLRKSKNPAFRVMPQVQSGSEAVYLKFVSISDKIVIDQFYHDCPRERIFKFPNYDAVLDRPRVLYYDCLYGLETFPGSHKVYLITLRSIPGGNVTYTVTNYHQKNEHTWTTAGATVTEIGHDSFEEARECEYWKPVIATALVHDKLHIVLEQAPSYLSVDWYEVWLTFTHDGTSSPIQKIKQNTTTFGDLYRGNYTVHVTGKISNEKNCFWDVQSYPVQVPDSFPQKPTLLPEKTWFQLAAIIMGCFGGMLIVIVFGFALYSRRCPRPPCQTVTIAVYAVNEPEVISHRRVVHTFMEFLEKVYMLKVVGPGIPERSDGLSALNEVTHAIFVCSPSTGLPFNNEDHSTSCYFRALDQAVDRKSADNNLHIYAVKCPYGESNRCVPQTLVTRRISEFLLPDDLESLYRSIFPGYCLPSNQGGRFSPNNYSATPEGFNLMRAIAAARESQSAVPESDPSVTTDDYVKKLNNFNFESSVISESQEDLGSSDEDSSLPRGSAKELSQPDPHRPRDCPVHGPHSSGYHRPRHHHEKPCPRHNPHYQVLGGHPRSHHYMQSGPEYVEHFVHPQDDYSVPQSSRLFDYEYSMPSMPLLAPDPYNSTRVSYSPDDDDQAEGAYRVYQEDEEMDSQETELKPISFQHKHANHFVTPSQFHEVLYKRDLSSTTDKPLPNTSRFPQTQDFSGRPASYHGNMDKQYQPLLMDKDECNFFPPSPSRGSLSSQSETDIQEKLYLINISSEKKGSDYP